MSMQAQKPPDTCNVFQITHQFSNISQIEWSDALLAHGTPNRAKALEMQYVRFDLMHCTGRTRLCTFSCEPLPLYQIAPSRPTSFPNCSPSGIRIFPSSSDDISKCSNGRRSPNPNPNPNSSPSKSHVHLPTFIVNPVETLYMAFP